jgi:hypothetical protein
MVKFVLAFMLLFFNLHADPVTAVANQTIDVKGHYVQYDDPTGEPAFNWLYIPVNGQSVFKLEGTTDDGYIVWDILQGWGEESWESINIAQDGRSVTFGPMIGSGDEIPSGSATLRGTLRDAVSGDPLPFTAVYLTSLGQIDNRGVNPEAQTDANGNYIFEDIASGDYVLNFGGSGYLEATGHVTLEDGEDREFGQLNLIPGSRAGSTNFNGTIIDAVTGYGVSGATVRLRSGYYNSEGSVIATLVTDASGNFSTSISAGYYTVDIERADYLPSNSNALSVFDNGNGQGVERDFTMMPDDPSIGGDDARIILEWAENPDDLDSHFLKTDGGSTTEYHINYRNMSASSGSESAILDRDDTTSYGPETVTVSGLNASAVYKYFVHHYGGSGSIASTSQASVTINIGGQAETFRAPNQEGNVWKVFEIRNNVLVPCQGSCMYDVSPFDGELGTRNKNSSARPLLNGESKLFQGKK